MDMFCVLMLLLLVVVNGNAESQIGTVYWSNGQAKFRAGVLDKTSGAAYGTYKDMLMTNGWTVLEIKSGHGVQFEDDIIMYTSGFLEGALTSLHIYEHYLNMHSYFIGNNQTKENVLRNFFKEQTIWTNSMIQKRARGDPYWQHVSFIQSHFRGLVDGYNAVAKKGLDTFAFQLLNGVGDALDLMSALIRDTRPEFTKMSSLELQQFVAERGHCSALVKVTGAFEDIFMAHASWFSYSATLRIYKLYDFNVKNVHTAARKMSFSSYPGFLESLDDFYILGSNMVMLQTTNNIFNTSLYDMVKPSSLLAWQRVRIANMMADSGKQWADTVARFNSGTYNNQYMIIDLKQIKLRKSIGDNALWVVEQIPGLVMSGDQTPILRAGYWPSYNVPFYKQIYDMSGYPSIVKQHGTDFTYQLAPRAKIFRRDQDKVLDIEAMKYIMRYNDYKHDPYSESNPCNTICCRGDLRSINAKPVGCYDAKVADFQLAEEFTAHIISGPSKSHGLPPFSWNSAFRNTSHVGLPTVYDFDWITVAPSLS